MSATRAHDLDCKAQLRATFHNNQTVYGCMLLEKEKVDFISSNH